MMDNISVKNRELKQSPIGLGLASLGRPGYINLGHSLDFGGEYDIPKMEKRAHTILDLALKLGVRYFDVARSYGRAENFLSAWIKSRQISPNEISVGSKWGYYYTANWDINAPKHEIKEHSLSLFNKQVKQSFDLLGNDLDLYQIHSATKESKVLQNKKVLDEIARLKSKGIKIGITVTGPNQSDTLFEALNIIYDGVQLFDSVQCTWNLLEQSSLKACVEAHKAGLVIIIKEGLANGRLTLRNDNPGLNSRITKLKDICNELDTTIDALSLALIVAQPWVDIVLSGATTAEQLVSNMQALNLTINADVLGNLTSFSQDPEEYWADRGKLSWN